MTKTYAFPRHDGGYDFEIGTVQARLRPTDAGWRLRVSVERSYDSALVVEEDKTFKTFAQGVRWFFAWLNCRR